MTRSLFRLLATRRLGPLWGAMFLGALNDNLFKNAVALLVIYRLGASGGVSPQIIVTAAAGLFILPYFLFSATAGQLADRLEKSRLIGWVKLAEIPVALLGAAALFSHSAAVMLAALFLFGGQATAFGPVKYAVLPELLAEGDLIGGNALMEGGTFLAILLGTILGGLLILRDGGAAMVSVLMVGSAVLGYAAARFMPTAHPGSPGLPVSPHVLRQTLAVLGELRGRADMTGAVLGISWFWFFGATFLAQFPAFAKDVLNGDETVVTLMLTMFSLGIGLGSSLCARLLHGRLTVRLVPWAAVGMALLSLDFALGAGAVPGGSPRGLADFLGQPRQWRLLADLLGIAVCGGLYIVPLYTVMQARSAEHHRARVVAINNILNAVFMVGSAATAAALLAGGVSVRGVLLVNGLLNLPVAAALWGWGRKALREPPAARKAPSKASDGVRY